MSQATPPTVDEARVEADLRAILFDLSRTLGRFEPLRRAVMVVTVVGLATLFNWGLELTSLWRGALLAVVVGIFTVEPALAWLGRRLVRRARQRFDERFPPGGPERPVALRVLNELEAPNKAEAKLKAALGVDQTPETLITRRRREAPEGQIDAALGQAGPAPAPPAPTPPPAPEPPKTGGRFDYIPLDPRQEPPRGSGGPP
jgi:hypothetical protein